MAAALLWVTVLRPSPPVGSAPPKDPHPTQHSRGNVVPDVRDPPRPKIVVRAPPSLGTASSRSTLPGAGKRPYPGISERLRTEAITAHDTEPRDGVWAPAMEAAFSRRLATDYSGLTRTRTIRSITRSGCKARASKPAKRSGTCQEIGHRRSS